MDDTSAILSGTIGYEVNDYLKQFFGSTGIIILLVFTLLAYLSIRFKLNVHHITSILKKKEKEETKEMETNGQKEIRVRGAVRSGTEKGNYLWQ